MVEETGVLPGTDGAGGTGSAGGRRGSPGASDEDHHRGENIRCRGNGIWLQSAAMGPVLREPEESVSCSGEAAGAVEAVKDRNRRKPKSPLQLTEKLCTLQWTFCSDCQLRVVFLYPYEYNKNVKVTHKNINKNVRIIHKNINKNVMR